VLYVKLVSFSVGADLRLGVLVENELILDIPTAFQVYEDEAAGVKPPSDMISFLSSGEECLEAARRVVESVRVDLRMGKVGAKGLLYSLNDVKLKAPIPRPSKIVCLGLNYSDHAEEAGLTPPENPILFSKPPTAVIGHDEPVIYPKISRKVDYEVELAVIIGRKGREIPEEEAYDYVAGYTVFNDVSARDIQFRDGQWFRGKSFDTFAPMGPYLTLKDEIPDPHRLKMQMRVNGEVRQNSSTANMIFKVPYLVSFVSDVMTLEPGDVIATGTPAGVGFYAKPKPKLLKPGDVMEAYIEKIGTLRNRVEGPK